MILKILFKTFLLLSISSCSIFSSRDIMRLPKGSEKYSLTDKSGDFRVIRENGIHTKSKDYFSKYKIFRQEEKGEKIYEKSIVLSERGYLKKKLPVLRPRRSQYTVWFNGKKYKTDMELNVKNRSMKIVLKSPEAKWNKRFEAKFPKGTGVYCFYSQLFECVKATGFIDKSVDKKAGKMNFHIVWDGYPYIQEQYVNMPTEVFSKAILEYDGKNKSDEHRYTLKFRNQSLFYFINKEQEFIKKFWVSQGLSVIKQGYN